MADEKTETTAERVVTVEDIAGHISSLELPADIAALVGTGVAAKWDAVAVEIKPEQADAAKANGLTVEKTKSGKLTAGTSYVRFDALTIEGALAMNGGRMNKVAEGDNKGNGVLDYHNYGWDLGVRSTVRNRILAKLQGPEAAIERGVKGLVAAGIPEATARAIVIEQRKVQGLPV